MQQAALPPIYEVPEVIEKVQAVNKYIEGMVRARNLFAWKYFVHDLKVDIELWIYKLEEEHRQGGKETGIGAYCSMALQGALNYAFFYSAQKRKVNFETASLDNMRESDSGDKTPPAAPQGEIRSIELLLSIQQEFGDRIAELAEKVLDGASLSRAELWELKKTKNLREALHRVD